MSTLLLVHAMTLMHESPAATERDALPCLCCGNAVARCDYASVPRLRSIQRFVAMCVVLIGVGFAIAQARADELPRDSTYHLAVPLTDQDSHAFTFADGRGRARIVSMFYTSCKYVCPLIIDTLLKTERGLTPDERGRLDVLLVSFDPDNDTPDALKRVADKRHLDTVRWRLARTDKTHVRSLAAMLGIQYKQLEDREFSHSSALVLLDADGRIVARSDRLGEADADFVAAAKRVLAAD
jgi:protein SCO1/2